jgi:hypothetical protein
MIWASEVNHGPMIINKLVQAGERNVKVMLDRAVACMGWSAWLPGAFLQHITSSRSDHCPFLLHVESREHFCTPHHTIRYEVMWD